MKSRFFTISACALALVSLIACNKEQEDINEKQPNAIEEPVNNKGIPFEIVAGTPNTKTVNDGMSTNWVADDAITLFHVETGEAVTDACDNDEFSISSANLAAKVFTGTLTAALDGAKSYDWYAVYPHNTATDLSSVPINFFSSNDTRTATSGYDDVTHLAGTNMPLVGKAANVAAASKPVMVMENLAAVIKIVVTNNSGKALTITSLSVTAPEKIVGKFTANLNDYANPVYTPDASYAYATAILKITGGTSIADGDSQTLFIPVKPFALANGSDLSIKINTFTKTVTNTTGSAIHFNAGEIKKITFNYNKVFVSQNFTHTTSLSDGDKVIFTNGTTGSVKTMGHFASGSNIASVDGTITDGILASSSSMGIYTVSYDSETGYTFYDPETETYLNATSTTGSNVLKGISELDKYSYWTVSFDAGAAVITNKGKASRNIIRCNSSGTPFAAYSSGQDPVYLFKYDPRTPVTLSFATASVSKTTSNYAEFTGQTATSSPVVSPITYDMTGDDIGTINTATGEVSLNGTAGTATVTATYAGNATYMSSVASYSITVVGSSLMPSFSFTACPTGWPSGTKNSEIQALEGGNYNYVVSERTYTFTLSDDVGYHTTGYLAIMKNKYVGLPKLSGYKLVKVVVGNSSTCSTTTTLKITTDTAGSSLVSGGTAQTFSTTNSTYTYNLSGTGNNTMYYMYVSGNTQIITLALTYDKVD